MNVEKKIPLNEQPSMCQRCQRFFGSQAFDGLCSKCFNESKKQKGDQQIQIKDKEGENVVKKQESPEEKKEEDNKKQRPIQTNRNRCYECKKKVGLLGIECRCGYVFCSGHRLPEDHKCDFDHLHAGQEKLKNNMVKVAKGKIEEL